MLTHGFWLQQFGGDRDIVGKRVRLDRVPYEIVGVLPADSDVKSPAPKVRVPLSQEVAGEPFDRQVIWLGGRADSTLGRGGAMAAAVRAGDGLASDGPRNRSRCNCSAALGPRRGEPRPFLSPTIPASPSL